MEQEMFWVNGVVTQREGERFGIISNCLLRLPCDAQDKSLVTLICPHCRYKRNKHLNNNNNNNECTSLHTQSYIKLCRH